MSIGVVIPVKNEKGNVEAMVDGAIKMKILSEIIFVDGNSIDGTLELLVDKIKKVGDSRVTCIKQKNSFGKFQAIIQALPLLSCDHILIWDGDNTISFEDVSKIVSIYLEVRRDYNCIVVANRLTSIRLNKSFRFLNLVGNHLFSLLTWPIFGKRIPDVLSGVKIFPKHILMDSKNCKRVLNLDRYGDIAIQSFAKRNSLKFVSVPCVYKPRTYGKTSLRKWKDGSNMLIVFFHIFIHGCFKPQKNKDLSI